MRAIQLLMRKHLILFVIVFGWTAGAAAGQTSAAGALADAFVDAWNTHDVRAFGRLYADDADWVTVGGERHKGRVAIEGALAKEHASWARTTALRAAEVSICRRDDLPPQFQSYGRMPDRERTVCQCCEWEGA